jgi:short-subunit dehydrogenase
VELAGRKGLLPGASGGIGKAIARALHARGADLALTARRADVLEELCSELGGERVFALPADLTEREDVEKLAGRVSEADVLVANAGLQAGGTVDDFTPEQIDRAVDVNLRAPIQLARAMLPRALERGSGHLVFMSSLAGKVASPGGALYSTTKFGLRAFAAGLREDLHGTGVGVTTIFPGFIRDAGMFADSGAQLRRGMGTRTPEQVAEAVVRGIEQNKGEIDVAPLGLRAGVLLGVVAPGLAGPIQRRFGGADISHQIAEGHRDKR